MVHKKKTDFLWTLVWDKVVLNLKDTSLENMPYMEIISWSREMYHHTLALALGAQKILNFSYKRKKIMLNTENLWPPNQLDLVELAKPII